MRLPLSCLAALLLSLAIVSAVGASGKPEPITVGITPVFLDDQLSFLREWERYFELRFKRPVEFVQRANYREIVELTLAGKVDFAWICGYPYVKESTRLRLLAVPVYHGKPEYRAYLIVPADDRVTLGLFDLRGKVFAFSDRDSNSGFLVPQFQLLQAGTRADPFFRKTFYTGGHRNVVEAVAAGLADGGSVDGYIWDTLARLEPKLTARTRVVEKSQAFGFPPFVAGPGVKQADFDRMQALLVGMATDLDGQDLLARMNLDGFTPGKRALYQDIARMSRAVGAGN